MGKGRGAWRDLQGNRSTPSKCHKNAVLPYLCYNTRVRTTTTMTDDNDACHAHSILHELMRYPKPNYLTGGRASKHLFCVSKHF
jgi:hypothetical protein